MQGGNWKRLFSTDLSVVFVVRRVVVEQNPVRRAVEIVELTVFQRPEEGDQAEQAKPDRDGDQIQQAGHGRALRPTRSALPTTAIDEPDMAIAATSGVTWPAMASGTVTAL